MSDDTPATDDVVKPRHEHDLDEKNDLGTGVPTLDSPAVTRIDSFRRSLGTRSQLRLFLLAMLIWTIALAISSDTTFLYLAFATSYFGSNPLQSTIALLTSIVGAVCQPFWAKLADISSRPSCLAGAVVLYTVGYAVCAGSRTVTALAGGQVLYSLGSFGLSYLQTLIVSDTTPLRYRGLAYGCISFTFLPFTFVAPNIASGVGLTHWRWGYGMFCIIMPVCTVPLLWVLVRADRRAAKMVEVEHDPSTTAKPSLAARILRATLLLDPLGLILLTCAFSLLLAPPTLYSGAQGGWSNPSMIAMECVGGVVLVIFVGWEWKLARHPLLPRRVLNRNYCLCLSTYLFQFMAASVFTTYWTSWLWVAGDYNERQWTYISEAGSASLCAFSLVAGLVQRYTKRYRYMMIFGNATSLLALGLNYYSATSVGGARTVVVVFAAILYQGGAAFALIAAQTASQASVRHADLAVAIAIYIFVESIAGGIGAAVAGSIWSSDLAANLARLAPSLDANEILSIIGDITIARVSEPRDVIIAAYDGTYRKLALIALALIAVPVVTSYFAIDYVLDDRQNAVEEESVERDR